MTLFVVLSLTACADWLVHGYEPTLNTPYKNKVEYDKDISECSEWAMLTPRESARVNSNMVNFPLLNIYGYIQLAVLDKEPRDLDPRRRTSVINNINVCMERRGYDVNEAESHVPGASYPH